MSTISRELFFKLFGSGEAPGASGQMYANFYDRKVLLALARTLRPETVVEFGVNRGITAELLLRECPWIKRYVGVDAAPGFEAVLPGQQPEVPAEGEAGSLVAEDKRFKLLLVEGGTAHLDAAKLPKKADLVFVDCDHSAAGVRRETALARAVCRPGGVIVWHDYGNKTVEVTAVVDEMNRAEGDRICLVAATWVCFQLWDGGTP